MINNKKDWRFAIIWGSFWFLFIIVYFLLNMYLDQRAFKNSFESYKYYNIKENSSNLSYLRVELMDNQYFKNLVSFTEYEGSLNGQNSRDLLRSYLISLNKNNQRIYKIDEEYTQMCMSKSNFYSSIYEIFELKKEDYNNTLQYINFININNNKVCFDLSALDGVDEVTYIGINSFSVDESGLITCNLYYYSIYTNDNKEEETIYNLLLQNLKNNTLSNFNDVFINTYGGVVDNRIVTFKENPEGNFFKYTLISSKTIN